MKPEPNAFERAGQSQPGFLAEYWAFLRHSKKYWLLPIVLVMLVFAAFLLFAGTGAAPFIYTLF